MILITVVDNHLGMMFHHRRQSLDHMLREHILRITQGAFLWMNQYSADQFDDDQHDRLAIDEAFLVKAGQGEYCFTEEKLPPESAVEKLILYRWNRDYPADVFFGYDLSKWKLLHGEEFAGNSHERITMEVYTQLSRKNNDGDIQL